jgi:hypothetical protein
MPYFEIKQIETVDGSLPLRRCYSFYAQLAFGFIGVVLGIGMAVSGL